MADWVDVVAIEAFPLGAQKAVDVDGAAIAVFNIDGKYYAIEDVCTHDGGCLTGGPLEHDQIVCPRHGARFSVRTGEALTAPAYESVATFGVRVVDGILQVRDDRWD